MPTGLEIYDNAGNLKFGVTTKLVKFLGELQIDGATAGPNGSITDARFALADPFVEVIPADGSWAIDWYFYASVTGTTLNWAYGGGYRPDVTLIYGLY